MSMPLPTAAWSTPELDILRTTAQQQRYLAAMASGDMVRAIAMTEPGTGSDLQARMNLTSGALP